MFKSKNLKALISNSQFTIILMLTFTFNLQANDGNACGTVACKNFLNLVYEASSRLTQIPKRVVPGTATALEGSATGNAALSGVGSSSASSESAAVIEKVNSDIKIVRGEYEGDLRPSIAVQSNANNAVRDSDFAVVEKVFSDYLNLAAQTKSDAVNQGSALNTATENASVKTAEGSGGVSSSAGVSSASESPYTLEPSTASTTSTVSTASTVAAQNVASSVASQASSSSRGNPYTLEPASNSTSNGNISFNTPTTNTGSASGRTTSSTARDVSAEELESSSSQSQGSSASSSRGESAESLEPSQPINR